MVRFNLFSMRNSQVSMAWRRTIPENLSKSLFITNLSNVKQFKNAIFKFILNYNYKNNHVLIVKFNSYFYSFQILQIPICSLLYIN
jgi:hypothetical protein